MGFVKLVRKTPEVLITNTATSGIFNVTDPTGTLLNATGAGVATGFLGTFDIPFAMRFSLAQILGASDITNFCDRYKLTKSVIRIYFNSNVNSLLSPSSLPQLSYCVDSDDAGLPTTASLREKMGTKIKYFNTRNMIQITVYPKPTTEVYSNGIVTAYSPGKSMWLNTTYPSVEHYGLKGILQNVNLPASANSIGFKYDVTHTILGRDFQ